MSDRTISLRYMKALFDIDQKNEILEKRLQDFDILIKVLNENPKLVAFLKSPYITSDEKKMVLSNSFKDKFDTTFMNFLFSLINKQRFMLLELIAEEYKYKVNDHLEIWEGDIITAIPLDEQNENKLMETLKSKFHKRICLTKKVDPKIIGGVILIVGNEMLDWSVTGRLKKLKETIMATK